MTYTDAVNWREEHKNLIGTTDEKGFFVSDLFIVPSNSKNRDVFFRSYLLTREMETALIPYINEDVQVWSVDLDKLERHNILFYDILAF